VLGIRGNLLEARWIQTDPPSGWSDATMSETRIDTGGWVRRVGRSVGSVCITVGITTASEPAPWDEVMAIAERQASRLAAPRLNAEIWAPPRRKTLSIKLRIVLVGSVAAVVGIIFLPWPHSGESISLPQSGGEKVCFTASTGESLCYGELTSAQAKALRTPPVRSCFLTLVKEMSARSDSNVKPAISPTIRTQSARCAQLERAALSLP
jgi:hypothetical protein